MGWLKSHRFVQEEQHANASWSARRMRLGSTDIWIAQIVWSSGPTIPDGAFRVTGSEFSGGLDDIDEIDLTADLTAYAGNGATAAAWPACDTEEGTYLLIIRTPMREMQLHFDRAAGGEPDSMTVSQRVRSA